MELIKEQLDITATTFDIVVGKPAWTLEQQNRLFGFGELDSNIKRTSERFIPRILVDLGVAKSTSQVKRERPDLFQAFPDDCERFLLVKFGRNRMAFLVGPA